ncbi:alpha beta-hydrolase [Rhodocollybia butyracea]|uniref:Alpha beta-hydrolase n=1 Tax=Rhodocollybia butyracea TaxID=206335 RepID=A0A9P5Q5Y4_9AGAR|nr:alpha beta-hydrolase [Rhodocollybia butyracea]
MLKVELTTDIHCQCLPLVIVEGFLGHTGPVIWGGFERYLNKECYGCKRDVIFTSVGPVSSLHDRACDLYYALVGGTVDYGEEHSAIHNHSRHGRTNTGLYPQWSSRNPLHFLGHSIGGPTIIKLQHLLNQGHFGSHAHPDWIRSVNTISSPFRGTQAVYTLGECADAAPRVHSFSPGSIIAKGVHLISYLSPILPRSLDLHTESRQMSFRDISIVSLMRQLWKSDWAESRDATPFDVTFEAADKREADQEGKPHSKTFYRSCATYMTQKSQGDRNTHSVSFIRSPLLSHLARAIGAFDFSTIRPIPSFLRPEEGICTPSDFLDPCTILSEDYWANDGVVPLFTQWHPFRCSSTQCHHSEMKGLPLPGIWYVEQRDNTSHFALVPFWYATVQQKQYWTELGCWLRLIDLGG